MATLHFNRPWLSCLLLGTALFAAYIPPPISALKQFNRLNEQAAAASKAGNKDRHIAIALQMQALLNNAPDATEAVAQAFAAAGKTKQALAALQSFADMEQADDAMLAGQDKMFASLHDVPEYKALLVRFRENKTPITGSQLKFTLADSTLLPEDITYDPRSKSFLITSVSEKKIIRLTPDGASADFAKSPSNWPMMAIKADPAHGCVWTTEVALNGFTSVPKSAWGRSAVLCFDLQTGALRRRIEDTLHCSLGDMVLLKNGQPIVSDGDGGGIYSVVGNHLKRLDDGAFISPQTPALHPDGRHLFVPDYARGIGVLDMSTGQVTWLKQAGNKPYALNGIDGLYFDKGYLYLTQNGTSPERVVRLQLDPQLKHIIAEQVIERATPSLGDPTHGVFVGNDFYYIANSGWDQLDDHGDPNKTAKFTPACIMRFQ